MNENIIWKLLESTGQHLFRLLRYTCSPNDFPVLKPGIATSNNQHCNRAMCHSFEWISKSTRRLWLWINDQWSLQLNNHGQSHHTFCIISITQDDLILHSLSMLRAPAPKLTHTHTLPTHHSHEIEFFPIMDRSYSFQLSWKIKLRNRWSAQKMEA